MRLTTFAALAACALSSAALAQDATTFAPTGDWIFATDALADGAPVCSEFWRFGPNGALSVESGQERVTKTYRIETDHDGTWIVSRNLTTNHQPDCTGAVSSGVNADEHRTYVVPMNDGVVLTCPAPGHAPDGTPYTSTCYGRLMPASQVG